MGLRAGRGRLAGGRGLVFFVVGGGEFRIVWDLSMFVLGIWGGGEVS